MPFIRLRQTPDYAGSPTTDSYGGISVEVNGSSTVQPSGGADTGWTPTVGDVVAFDNGTDTFSYSISAITQSGSYWYLRGDPSTHTASYSGPQKFLPADTLTVTRSSSQILSGTMSSISTNTYIMLGAAGTFSFASAAKIRVTAGEYQSSSGNYTYPHSTYSTPYQADIDANGTDYLYGNDGTGGYSSGDGSDWIYIEVSNESGSVPLDGTMANSSSSNYGVNTNSDVSDDVFLDASAGPLKVEFLDGSGNVYWRSGQEYNEPIINLSKNPQYSDSGSYYGSSLSSEFETYVLGSATPTTDPNGPGYYAATISISENYGNSPTTYDVSVSGGDPSETYTYQWQYVFDEHGYSGGPTYTDISGKTGTSYTAAQIGLNGSVRVQVTAVGTGTVTSTSAQYIYGNSLTLSLSDDGTDITAVVSGGTTPYTYSWQDSSYQSVGSNSATLTPSASGDYSLNVTDSSQGVVDSNMTGSEYNYSFTLTSSSSGGSSMSFSDTGGTISGPSLFERVVPKGSKASFPFQASAASLTFTPVVYKVQEGTTADINVMSGQNDGSYAISASVVEVGGGVYSFRMAPDSGSATKDGLEDGCSYYAICTATHSGSGESETIRIPVFAYSPAGHLDDLFGRLGQISFSDAHVSSATSIVAALDALGSALTDVDSANSTISSNVGSDADSASASGSAHAKIKQVAADVAVVDANVDSILADTAEMQGDLADGGRLDVIFDAILADTAEMQADLADGGRIDAILDELTSQGDTNESKLDVIDGIVDTILLDTAEMQGDLANGGRLDVIFDAILADTDELQGDWVNGGRLDLLLDRAVAAAEGVKSDWDDGGRLDVILDEIQANVDTNEGKIDIIDGNVDQIEAMLGALADAASADYGTDKSLMAMARKLGADIADLDGDLVTAVAALVGHHDDTQSDISTLSALVTSETDAIDTAVSNLASQVTSDTDAIDAAIVALDAVVDAGFAAAQVDLDAILADTIDIQSVTDDWKDGGRLDLILDEIQANVDTNEGKIDTIDANVDLILADTAEMQADLANGGRLDVLIDRAVAAAEAAENDLANATDGLGALKAGIDANQTDLNTILADTAEMQADLADGGRLDAIFDELTSQGDTNEGKLDTIDTVVDAILVDTAELQGDWANGGRLDLILDELTTQGDTNQSLIGAVSDSSSASSVFGKIASMRAVVDQLQTGVNARMVPSVPDLYYSSSSAAVYMPVSVSVIDGATGSLEDPDSSEVVMQFEFDGSVVSDSSVSGSADSLFEDSAGSTALGNSGISNSVVGSGGNWFAMKRSSEGVFAAYVKFEANAEGNFMAHFRCADSDPSGDAAQFLTSKTGFVRSPIGLGTLGAAGAF